MKRHPSLAHLSREHHGALILARLLQYGAPAYKGLPTDIEGKGIYALKFYKEVLIKHFEREEKALTLVTGFNTKLDLLLKTITGEHKYLHLLAKSIKNHPDDPGHLDAFGKALEIHIRKEERELFPLIQETCSEEQMKEIDQLFSPKIKKDIENRTDIELLVNHFYEKVLADNQLGFIFQGPGNINWSTHLPAMYSFWENVILFTGTYEGNPMNLHKNLHHITPLNESHFDQWNHLFICTVDELFEGKKAILAKQRAISISAIIKEKLIDYRQGNN